MNKQTEIANYFIDGLNEFIDLSSLVDENGETLYHDNPFVSVGFFTRNDGSFIKRIGQSEILRQKQFIKKRFIYVGFAGESPVRENIRPIGENPIESYISEVRMTFMVRIDDKDEFTEIFNQLEDYTEEKLRFVRELADFDGGQKQFNVNAGFISDRKGTIQLINKVNYKNIGINCQLQILNKGLLYGSYLTYKIDSEDIPTLGKSFNQNKENVDNTRSGKSLSKFIPDVGQRTVTFTFYPDYNSSFTQKVFNEIKADEDSTVLSQTYSIQKNYNFLDGTITANYNMYLASINENAGEVGQLSMTVTFVEV